MVFSQIMTDKKLKRWVILTVAALIVALFAIIGISSSRKFYVCFYSVPVSVQTSLTKNINNYLSNSKSKQVPVIVTLDDGLSLQNAVKKVKKCDLLFTFNGRNLDEILAGEGERKANQIEPDIYSGMTINMMKLAQYDGKNLAVPLLTDHFEIAYSRYWLDKASKAAPETMNDLLAYIAACNKYSVQSMKTPKAKILQWDLFFAASDPDTLLQLTGAYLQAAYGIQSCNALGNAIRAGKPFDAIIKEPLDSDGHTLATVLDVFKDWESSGLLHAQWTAFTLNDVKQFMKADLAPVAFMPLSVHRTLDSAIIVNYSASFFPVLNVNAPQAFTAPVICGVQLKKSPVIPSILQNLASQNVQAELSKETGLAPVNTRAAAADREADDVRYWTAATEPPYPGLDRAAFTTPADRKAFAEKIAAYVNSPK
jgi:hypothetical protein